MDSTGFVNLAVGLCTYKMRTLILHPEIKWLENVSLGGVFDREKDIHGGKEKGNPL